jgi:hypothetical protein
VQGKAKAKGKGDRVNSDADRAASGWMDRRKGVVVAAAHGVYVYDLSDAGCG